MHEQKRARLVFKDGTCFDGTVFSPSEDCVGEVVFNTAMTGYQEVLTDPSYFGQMVVLTYPEIGNYGINDEDAESRNIFLEALIVKSYNAIPSNQRSTKTLKDYLREKGVMGVEGVDTRALTLYLRDRGSCSALLSTSDAPLEELIHQLNRAGELRGNDAVRQVTARERYDYTPETPAAYRHRVAVVDCGVKTSILRALAAQRCRCTVFPSTTPASELLNGEAFDGIFISNGPGDPEPVVNVVEIIRSALGNIPIFGICMGHQLLGQALGLKIGKLPFGHHGVNHPIKHLKTGAVEITSQNHNFVVETAGCDMTDIDVTHINLNDQTIAGIQHKKWPAFSVQYHPESSPGPHDSSYLFEAFSRMMANFKQKKSSNRDSA